MSQRNWRPLFAAVADEDVFKLYQALEKPGPHIKAKGGRQMRTEAVAKALEQHGRERRRFSNTNTPYVIVPLPAFTGIRRGTMLYLRLWLLLRSPTAWKPSSRLPLHEWRGETVDAVRVYVRELLRSYEKNPVLAPRWDYAAYLRLGVSMLEGGGTAAWESPEAKRQRKANAAMYGDW